MATARLSGSPGQVEIECRHRPPPPGCHEEREGGSHSPALICQLAPPSELSNRTPGSPPAYIEPSASPDSITQIRTSACSPPAGGATPSARSQPALGSSVYKIFGP